MKRRTGSANYVNDSDKVYQLPAGTVIDYNDPNRLDMVLDVNWLLISQVKYLRLMVYQDEHTQREAAVREEMDKQQRGEKKTRISTLIITGIIFAGIVVVVVRKRRKDEKKTDIPAAPDG